MAHAQREMIYLGDHRALTRTVYGHKLFLDTRDVSLTPHLLLDGYWESWVTEVFMRLVRPGMTVVDVGANVGWYSLLAAMLVGPEGRVFSFEADPDTHRLLSDSLEVNGFRGRTVVEQVAVADSPGEVGFHRFLNHRGSNSIRQSEDDAAEFGDSLELITVPSVSLDAYFADSDVSIDVLKIDAEGAEPAIVAGAQRLLAATPGLQVLIEYEARNRPALESLLELGYSLSRIDEGARLLPATLDELDAGGRLEMLHLTRPAGPRSPLWLLAFGEEIAEAPEMIDAFAASFGEDETATLVVQAPAALGALLEERCRPLIERAGLARDRGAEVILLACDHHELDHAGVAVDVIYSRREQPDRFASLPRVDDSELRTLQLIKDGLLEVRA